MKVLMSLRDSLITMIKGNRILSIRWLVLSAMIIAIPARGQNMTYRSSLDDKSGRISWLEKETSNEIKALVSWQQNKDEYDAALAEVDSLQVELAGLEDVNVKLENRRLLWQKQETLLSRQKVDRVLSTRYDKESVEAARESLQDLKNSFGSDYKDMDSRLEMYGSLSEELRRCLSAVDDLRFVQGLKQVESLSEHQKEKFIKEDFTKFSELVPAVLLDSRAYPYLHGILEKALKVKLNNPSDGLQDLIDQL